MSSRGHTGSDLPVPLSVPGPAPGAKTAKAKSDSPQRSNLIVFSLENRKRQTRICTTKSRTGCKQCKQRRMKCDENKPSCNKCVARGLDCDSMLDDKAVPSSSVYMSPNHKSKLFANQREWDYFELFLTTSAPGGCLPVVAMMKLFPQMALQQPTLRSLCCAIGASAASYKFLDGGKMDGQLRREALQYHTQAINLCRTFKGTTTQMLRLALMSSYLFMGFEIAYNNSVNSALIHFRFAHHMMQQYISILCKEKNLTPAELKFDYIENAIFSMLQRYTVHRWPDPTDFEPELDLAIRSCCQIQPIQYLADNAPGTFSDVQEAYQWWDKTLHHLKHHLRAQRLQAAARGDHTTVFALITEAIETLRNWRIKFLPVRHKAQQHKDSNPWFYIQALTMESLYTEVECAAHALGGHAVTSVPMSPRKVHFEMIEATRRLFKPIKIKGKGTPNEEYAVLQPLGFVVYKSRDKEVLDEVERTLGAIGSNTDYANALRTHIRIRHLEGWEKNEQLVKTMRSWAMFFTMTGCAGLPEI